MTTSDSSERKSYLDPERPRQREIAELRERLTTLEEQERWVGLLQGSVPESQDASKELGATSVEDIYDWAKDQTNRVLVPTEDTLVFIQSLVDNSVVPPQALLDPDYDLVFVATRGEADSESDWSNFGDVCAGLADEEPINTGFSYLDESSNPGTGAHREPQHFAWALWKTTNGSHIFVRRMTPNEV